MMNRVHSLHTNKEKKNCQLLRHLQNSKMEESIKYLGVNTFFDNHCYPFQKIGMRSTQ